MTSMQPPTDGPRAHLTVDQVVALIQDAPAVKTSAGMELLDMSLSVVEDISDDFVGGSVSRASYAILHATSTLGISRDLDWGRALVRPYFTMTDGVVTARFNVGAYFTSRPRRRIAASPNVHEVRGYDILHALASPVGDSYALAAGTGYLANAEAILGEQGYTAYIIDQHAAGVVLPNDRAWVFDDRTTWLHIVNDLLAAVGYQGIWSDWDGRLRMQPYQRPQDRAVEWRYGTGEASMVDPDREIEQDYFETPNRWVFYRSGIADGPPPVEGSGIYTFVNEYSGPTSVAARDRVITAKPQGLDVADHPSLVAAAQSIIDADLRLQTTVTARTWPNPLHWHFDRLVYDDLAAGPAMQCLGTQWTLPLNGDQQKHEWSVL